MLYLGLFIAGLLSAAIVTAQVLAISRRRALGASALEFVAWCLWALVLGEIVVDGWNIIPYAAGAALGTYLVTRRRG